MKITILLSDIPGFSKTTYVNTTKVQMVWRKINLQNNQKNLL